MFKQFPGLPASPSNSIKNIFEDDAKEAAFRGDKSWGRDWTKKELIQMAARVPGKESAC